MTYSGLNEKMTGVLIPVFSLRSQESGGTGEFLDLVPFGKWCRKAGLDLIQLLPVNDTGDDPSPYSALSAFALHPLYIRIQSLPEFESMENREEVAKKLANLRVSHINSDRLQYRDVLYGKIEILRDIYRAAQESIADDTGFKTWVRKNPWVREYAVFRALKDREQLRGWIEWSAHREPTGDDLQKLWRRKDLSTLFFAWIQYRLEEQFLHAVNALKDMGILLKGDIPILMNEDSADVWAHRNIFHFDLRAGAPPDMFSSEGQNWGFPVYNWDELESQDFDWWRRRLLQANKFYQAFRIDHVLGFFRIWTVPHRNDSGVLGYFLPTSPFDRADLYRIGFDDGRIRWLAEPHVFGSDIRERFGIEAGAVIAKVFRRIQDEDLFLFRDDIGGERGIRALDIDPETRSVLLDWYRDRALIQVSPHEFAPAWKYADCTRYAGLEEREKTAFESLVAEKREVNEELWEKNGEKLLTFMLETVDMLTCAEDLGVIPACVPRTLESLGILGLKIPRWSRLWDEPGEPYIPVEEYPFLSVCAPSVHDTSTLRDWWEHEEGQEDFWRSLGFADPCPNDFNEETAERIIERLQSAGSALCVYQIQDFFALVPSLRAADSRIERMNVPGTVRESNWSYRLPVPIETLDREKKLIEAVKRLTRSRKAIPDKKDGSAPSVS